MKLLAIETATDTMSLAVQDGDRVWTRTGVGGAQASAAMLPAIGRLMRDAGLGYAELDAIAFGRGPGAFTGLRTACAVAQGLGFGAGVPLLPVDTLLAVAEAARRAHGATRVVALMDARMDQVYGARYVFERGGDDPSQGRWHCEEAPWLGSPEEARVPPGYAIAGNADAVFGARLAGGDPSVARHAALPDAASLLGLAPALLAAGGAVAARDAMPLYIRDKVAQTTDERVAAKAAKDAATSASAPSAVTPHPPTRPRP